MQILNAIRFWKLGLVKAKDKTTWEIKYYVWKWDWIDEDADVQNILKRWQKVDRQKFISFFDE